MARDITGVAVEQPVQSFYYREGKREKTCEQCLVVRKTGTLTSSQEDSFRLGTTLKPPLRWKAGLLLYIHSYQIKTR